ncbi:nucleotide disphospho-sugar-binding domain-containing protein [Mobilicoccus caccae]|uniref:Glycosyl transferase n=1 Tax=Mobilicoccus caccae TaxID=1859295 RepID=A0ABQ6IS20_9MICO|nr:nucleotide disphospho-sugar-binding domain-containing protein [Mobilicoccus caccae]GMA39524.1 glycosyl transferase [Mobilicoccus caccae]
MSHVLLATTPFAGHQPPLLGLARELVGDGHRVTYYTGARFGERAEAVGATWLPWVEAKDFDDTDLAAAFPTMRTDASPAAMFSSFEQLFFGTAPGQLRDLLRLHATDPVDVVVNELTCVGGGFLHEAAGVPWASFSLSPLPLASRHLPPSGLPVRPGRGPIGRGRDAALRALVRATLGRRFRDLINVARTRAGLAPTSQLAFDSLCSPTLLLGQGVPSLEYRRPDLPGHVHLVGDTAAGTRAASGAPSWLQDLDPGRPIVHVTSGTLGLPGFDLVGAAVAALAETPAQVVVSGDPALVPAAANVVAPGWVPHDLLLPRTAVMITNGGYGAVSSALAHGVPLVVVPGAQDKPEVARRVAWSGAGLDIGGRPSPARLRRAVERCVGDSPQRRRAHEVAAEFHRAGGARRAADLVTTLARP